MVTDVVSDCSSIDRISQLPESILQRILYLLSQKDATRTSILSKAWRYVWSTRPNISYSQHDFCSRPLLFLPTLEKALQAYNDKNLCIEEFHLKIYVDHSDEVSFLQYWIPIVLRKGVKKFHLNARRQYDITTGILFEAESLQDLYLGACKLDSTKDPFAFNNLKNLRLGEVHIEEETFQRIISSCPLIEYVGIEKCCKLKTINLNKLHNLRDFAFVVGEEENSYAIISHVPSLIESISIDDYKNYCRNLEKDSRFRVKMVGLYNNLFLNLKNVKLHGVELSETSFNSFSSNFPWLEEFVISNCYGFDKLKLSSTSIKKLVLVKRDKSIEIDIDAPNMAYFEFSGYLPQSISFATTSSGWKSVVSVLFLWGFGTDASSWFLKLNGLLKGLSRSQISLNIFGKINHYCAGPLLLNNRCKPVAVEEVRYYRNSKQVKSFVNDLLRGCCPRNISPEPVLQWRL